MIDTLPGAYSLPSENTTLWRYMDLTKLLALLETKSLYFARADTFEDPFEGHWPAHMVKRFESFGAPGRPPKILRIPAKTRKHMFISCWCGSVDESAALWELYLQSSEGVAVRTDLWTLKALLDNAPHKILLSKVVYFSKQSTAQLPWNESLLSVFMWKRMSFSHENEFRALIYAESTENRRRIRRAARGVLVPISVPDLIKSLYVSPTAPAWFGELVEKVLRRYGIQVPIERSDLSVRPTY